MPTALPVRRADVEDFEFPGVPLFAVPLAIVCFLALMDGQGVTLPAVLGVILRAGEALIEAEIAFGMSLAERIARLGS
jgi:hypothetical protein